MRVGSAMMRASGEGRQRLIAIMSVMAVLIGGTVVAGRLAPRQSLHPSTLDLDHSESPLSKERREKLRQLQKIVTRLRSEAREGNWEQITVLAEKDAYRSGLLRALKAEALARQGKHTEVVQTLSKLYKNHSDPSFYLLTGKREAYERLVASDMAAVELNPKSAGANIHAAWIASLDSEPRPQAARLLQLAERGVELSEMPAPLSSLMTLSRSTPRRNTGQPDRADALRVLGITLFRQGRYADAVENLRKSESMRSTPHLWAYLSLSLRRLGNQAEADKWDQELRRYLSITFGAQARPTEFYIYLRELDAAKPT